MSFTLVSCGNQSNEIDRLNKEITVLQETKQNLQTKITENIKELKLLSEEITILQKTIKNLQIESMNVDDDTLLKDIIGVWQDSPSVGSGFGNKYHFLENSTFIFDVSDYDTEGRIIYKLGTWKIEKGLLYMYINTKYYRKGGFFEENTVSSLTGYSLIDFEIVKNDLKELEIIIYPIDENDYDNGDLRISKSFGGIDYYRLSKDPNIYLDYYNQLIETFY